MSAKSGSNSGNGRRDAGNERPPFLSPISEKLCSASAWENLSQLASSSCPACELEALARAKRDTYEALFALNERIRSCQASHGASPPHAKSEVIDVIVVEGFDLTH